MANKKLEKLLDAAINFIVERECGDDYICESMLGDYCKENCNGLNKTCVRMYLEKVTEQKKK